MIKSLVPHNTTRMSATNHTAEHTTRVATPNDYYGMEEVHNQQSIYENIAPSTAGSSVSPELKGLTNDEGTKLPVQEPVIYHVLEAPPQVVQTKQDNYDNLVPTYQGRDRSVKQLKNGDENNVYNVLHQIKPINEENKTSGRITNEDFGVTAKKKNLLFNKFCFLTLAVVILWMVVIVLAMVGFIQLYNQNTPLSSTPESTSTLQRSNENISVHNYSTLIQHHIQNSSMMFNEVHEKLAELDRNFKDFQENISNVEKLNRTLPYLVMNILMKSGTSHSSPALSCASILQLRPTSLSDYYWVLASNGSAVHVYCAMTAPCEDVGGGWARIPVPEIHPGLNSTTSFPSAIKYSKIITKVWVLHDEDDDLCPYYANPFRNNMTVKCCHDSDFCLCSLKVNDFATDTILVETKFLSSIIWLVKKIEVYVL